MSFTVMHSAKARRIAASSGRDFFRGHPTSLAPAASAGIRSQRLSPGQASERPTGVLQRGAHYLGLAGPLNVKVGGSRAPMLDISSPAPL